MTDTKSIADRMAEAAEMDLALPFSLMCDAWDIAYEAGCVRPNYGEWAACLLDALDAYEADQLGYWTKERIARARGEESAEAQTGGLVLWPQLNGTAGTIESDAIRALVGYVEQRDNA